MELHVYTSYFLALTRSPEKADQIEDLHKRVARRIMDLISSNGGLYIKLGMCHQYAELT